MLRTPPPAAQVGVPLGTPNPPQWRAELNPTKFVKDYEYWCVASNLQDENVLAAKFAFSFAAFPQLMETVQGFYMNECQTWHDMKQKCIELLRECSSVTYGDYDSAHAIFMDVDTFQKYNEPIVIFEKRWQQYYNDYALARQANQLAPMNAVEQLIEFKSRLIPEMQNVVMKKKEFINTVADATREIKKREQ